MKPEFTERYGKLADLDRSFDLKFWQAQTDEARFAATAELIAFALRMKGIDANQLRLERTVESFQRQER